MSRWEATPEQTQHEGFIDLLWSGNTSESTRRSWRVSGEEVVCVSLLDQLPPQISGRRWSCVLSPVKLSGFIVLQFQ